MRLKLRNWSIRYEAALRRHLTPGLRASPKLARGLGIQAVAAGLQTLDLAKAHEQILVTALLPEIPATKRVAYIRQAGSFFAAAITPIEQTHRSAQEAGDHLKKIIETLSERTVELAASNRELSLEITQRQAAEEALKKSESHYSKLLEQSDRLQEQLRRLTRQILSAQEDERKKISRELHDVIAQALTDINLRLATLKTEATVSRRGLQKKIANTQRLVEHSVDIVHRFARELRPAVLDDLGLIPALHSVMRNFTTRTGIRASLTASARVELLDTTKRTVLFRVAQEALTNVARHSKASQVEVSIQKLRNRVYMKIKDNGESFDVERALHANVGKRLGLVGMRERLEMVGGSFAVESAPTEGTTILAQFPSGKARSE